MILLEHDIDDSPARRLPSPGKCIYCGASGIKLNDEHVIPYAIGKNATILEGACCEVCQKIIQPYEQEVLKKQLGVFRAMVEAPTRNKKDRPKSIILPLVEYDEQGRPSATLAAARFLSLRDPDPQPMAVPSAAHPRRGIRCE